MNNGGVQDKHVPMTISSGGNKMSLNVTAICRVAAGLAMTIC